tara:strand:- start:6588 stop:6791 length:204 start_codon:yes stop_codon:yes gene_type:complete
MFKTKFILLDTDWKEIYSYNSRVKPIEGEFIYIGEHKSYYKVMRVIHSIDKPRQTILVIEIVKNFSK